MMKKFIFQHKFLLTILIGILGGLLTLAICNGQEQQDFSRYGLLNWKSGLQKIFNVCQADPNITVVAYYRMDGPGPGIPDLSGNELDLSEGGNPTYLQPDYLGLNRAILFNPENSDHYYHEDVDFFELYVGETKYDAVFWVVCNTTEVDNPISIVHKRVVGDKGYVLYKHANNKLCFSIDNGISSASIYSNNAINDGIYRFFQINLDRSDKAKMFKNGAIQISQLDITAIEDCSNDEPFTFCKNSAANNMYWNGSQAGFLMIKAEELPAWVLSMEFAKIAYDWAMGLPKSLPREIN
jgi:hypothetical protein